MLETDLQQHVDGEIHFDEIHRTVYSVDASIFEIPPTGIVIPRTKEALLKAVAIACKHRVPIIPRGAATGITGGCIGQGLIIDTSKFLHRILEINWEKGYVRCEPGVVQDRLNEALAIQGYCLGPDTSTGNRATLGGMLANNSAGARSLRFGTMADHVQEVELLLSSGELLRFANLPQPEWKERKSKDRLSEIYQTLWHLREKYGSIIEKQFPQIPRRVSGYNLDALMLNPFNPCRLIAGSEGTLGIATEIQMQIVRKPAFTGLCVLWFDDIFKSMQAVETMLHYHPMALELIDDQIIEGGRRSPSMRGKLGWLKGSPKALIIAEFETPYALQFFAQEMNRLGIGEEQLITSDPQIMAQVWDLRKSGLGLLLSKRNYSRAIAFLEDISVHPRQLAPFMKRFCKYLESKGKSAGIYGHVGSGCMHIRPYINLRQKEEIALMVSMMKEVADLLLEHGGALSGEHGDGLIRSWLNRKMFGDQIYQAFVELKYAFDPENLMNPGKVVHSARVPLESLRIDSETREAGIQPFLDWSAEGGIALAADLCNGNGMCRKAEKVMCPSFQVSGDEFDTTRARAQAFRSVLNGKRPKEEWAKTGLHEVLDLCLECKGCKTECPSEVDMAKMKAEFLYHYQKENGVSWRSLLFARIGEINRWGSLWPEMFNWMSRSVVGKGALKKLGITPERELPSLAPQRFSRWWKSRSFSSSFAKEVVLHIDTFTEFNCPEIGQAAVRSLEALGYSVIAPQWHCCGRPAISKGLLPYARQLAQKVVDVLYPYAAKGLPIIGLEPSCLLTLKDDYGGLLGVNHHKMQQITKACTTFDEFLAEHIQGGQLPFVKNASPIKVHTHCYQKALVGSQATLQVLQALTDQKVIEVDSGCCGMAGSFGYEIEHYDFSLKIAELKLFPEIRKSSPETVFVANGFSCRSQIKNANHCAFHLAELL